MLEFMKLGYPVLTPYGDCQRYDFVVEINGKFYRIQSKTANDAYIRGITFASEYELEKVVANL